MKNYQVLLLMLVVALTQGLPNEEGINSKKLQDGSPRGRFVDIGGLEYFISDADEQVSASTALIRCDSLGMRLVSYDSMKKQAKLESYFSTDATYPFWTSGIYYANDQWLWRGSGTLFSSTSPGWAELEPGYYYPPDSCVLMSGSGREAELCTGLYTYLCEPLCTGAK